MNISNEDIKLEKIVSLLDSSISENSTLYDNIYNLYVLISIAKGVSNVKHGNAITLEEFNKEREELYERYNRKYG